MTPLDGEVDKANINAPFLFPPSFLSPRHIPGVQRSSLFNHGVPKYLHERAFYQVLLPGRGQFPCPERPRSKLSYLRAMGALLGFGAIGECLPAGQRWEGEHFEGAKHRWYVSQLWQFGGSLVVLTAVTTEGELIDLIEDFSEGRVQFAFVKVKDPNTGLPKHVLIGWVSCSTSKVGPLITELTC
jgi:hypothetical protein